MSITENSHGDSRSDNLSVESARRFAAAQLSEVRRAERARAEVQERFPEELESFDEILAGMRIGLANSLLMLSKKRRNAEDYRGARRAIRLYGQQDDLARILR